MRARLLITSLLLLSCSSCSHSDPNLNQRVSQRLAEDGALRDEVTVSTNGRIVRLDGVVASDAERERFEHAARSVEGVLAIDNRLTTRPPVTPLAPY